MKDFPKEKKKESKRRSMQTRAFWTVFWGAVILFFVLGINECAMQALDALEDYKRYTQRLMNYTLSILDEDYLYDLAIKTIDIYESLPEEIRSEPDSEEYQSRFDPLLTDDYYRVRDALERCRVEGALRKVFLFFNDEENDRLIYIVDGDEMENSYQPGQWVSSSEWSKIDMVLYSRWFLTFNYKTGYGWVGTNYLACMDSDQSVVYYVGADIDINDLFFNRLRFLLIYLIGAVILVIIIAMILSSRIHTSVIAHIDSLSEVALEYAARDKVNDGNTETFFEPLAIDTGDEIESLWRSLCHMEEDMSETMRRLKKATAERERIGAEVKVMKEIQDGLIPDEFPERPEFQIFGSMHPAREVGGDLFDAFCTDEDHLVLVVGDVSGKGISASLFMTITTTLIKDHVLFGSLDPGKLVGEVNQRLVEKNEANLFVTLWLGILTISTGRLVYVNAGHEFPAVRRQGGEFALFYDQHSIPVGAMEGATFATGELQLSPGDVIFQYSDGITEANNPKGELFGVDRLVEALNCAPDASPEELDSLILRKVSDYAQGQEQFDDITILCLKYLG